jgi:hypothetical protein
MVERMKYIAARESFGSYLYFKDNINDSPKWTRDKQEAMRFNTSEDAVSKSDTTGVYADEIISLGVEE